MTSSLGHSGHREKSGSTPYPLIRPIMNQTRQKNKPGQTKHKFHKTTDKVKTILNFPKTKE
ncbi:MAG: hypothetical protein EGQ58_16305 [Phocaeicola dorei]|uniref:Uncharacterized protein n=2 Tax=Phocaeicola dorei TaxID=357276 RepID=A0A1Y3ZIA0_9BACT|nr:hypothetical protein ABI39_14570 [Phocaeicola dorei CL03T12C01]EEB23059.1 hypothetical protein BACDOR_04462 [Phocaeicola dorei DSM 17855]EEZ22752.1 hypothetical protein HMPREF0105_0136 [Bacteroides sp. 3_1_33FAA]KAA5291574.1 hypothetical protein F2Z06_11180 [Phocaeicola dorei]RGD23816.1 hypothetical protein DW646_18345 [Bacteroides sp. AM23-18]RGD35639.1 hypothetical protein DW230_00250 [Bacteroides sp. AM18-9]RGP21447.1 hypothetical protein DW034_07935 [Bacteroides sp. AF39-10AT]RJU75581